VDIDKDIVIFLNVIVTEVVSIILLLVISSYIENLITIIIIKARGLGSENISSRVGSNDGTCFARISHGIRHLIL